jgi:glyoxylase-like metal-dependent hydrolase (beta-lactamase superfamily II)
MPIQIGLSDAARASENLEDASVHEVAPDLAYRRLTLVNVVFYGLPDTGDRNWVLIDTGIPGSKHALVQAAEARFGRNARPRAVILTHGHFDHVGAVEDLATE